MGTLQKKEVEVSCRLKTKEMHILQGCTGPVYNTTGGQQPCCRSSHRLEHKNMCKQSNSALQELGPPKEGCLKASQALNSKQLMQLSAFTAKLDQDSQLNPCEAQIYALGASLAAAFTAGLSSGCLDRRDDVEAVDMRHINHKARESRCSNLGKDSSSGSNGNTDVRDRCLSCKHEAMPFFLENFRNHELSLSSLTLGDPISLANISGKSSLLDILNYFPSKAPVVSSRKKLLILDINGILADIVYPPPKGYKADTKIAGRAVFARPFCADFLNFCLERFNVAIWSSRSRKIIDRLLNYLMGDMKHKLMFCWDLSHCTDSKFRTLENKHKALVFKELRKVWETYDPDLPWERGFYNESNTLLLDDTPYKALLNPPHTSIFPYSYEYKDVADDALGPGGIIRVYLEELAGADNVQKYIEKHPFGQSAITERSLSWQFYDKVIKEQSAVPAGG